MIAAVLAIASLGGCALLRAAWHHADAPPADEHDLESPNRDMALNGYVMELALFAYARDHEGRRPSPDSLVAELTRDDYLPGNRLMSSPWGEVGERIRVVAIEAPDADPLMTEAASGLTPDAVFARHPLAAEPGTALVLVCPDRRHSAVIGVGDAEPRPVIVYGPLSLVTSDLRPVVEGWRRGARAKDIL